MVDSVNNGSQVRRENGPIEEEASIMRKIEEGYRESLDKLEREAKEGIKQREEVIVRLKGEKRMIMGELQGRVREITGLKERIAEVEKSYEGLQKQSKQGEQLMEKQVRDLT
jgi:hypothetical protein